MKKLPHSIKVPDFEVLFLLQSIKDSRFAEPLHNGTDGLSFQDKWDYATLVGMLLYLSNNSRSDITYAINQCARFAHDPNDNHAKGIKRIIRCLKEAQTQGMTICPTMQYTNDRYVGVDFGRLWGSEDEKNY